MDATTWIEDTGEPRAQKCACVVRRRAGGKGLQPQYLACGLSYWLLLTNGSKEVAYRLRDEIQTFLQDELKLELSVEKTHITHVNDGFDFLGYVRHESCTRGCCD